MIAELETGSAEKGDRTVHIGIPPVFDGMAASAGTPW
jgi:hypothetical protein